MKTPKSVSLSSCQILALSQLKNKWTNSIQLREAGVLSPPPRISELKAKGAVIETDYREVEVAGEIHKGVAFYRLTGWDI